MESYISCTATLWGEICTACFSFPLFKMTSYFLLFTLFTYSPTLAVHSSLRKHMPTKKLPCVLSHIYTYIFLCPYSQLLPPPLECVKCPCLFSCQWHDFGIVHCLLEHHQLLPLSCKFPISKKTWYYVSFLPGSYLELPAHFSVLSHNRALEDCLPDCWHFLASPLVNHYSQAASLHPFKRFFSYSPMTYIIQNSMKTFLSSFNSRFEALLYPNGNLFPFLSLALSLTPCSPSCPHILPTISFQFSFLKTLPLLTYLIF